MKKFTTATFNLARSMAGGQAPPEYGRHKALECRICIRGRLPETWQAWRGGLSIEDGPAGQARLAGRLPDQAALFGVLERLRDAGIEVVRITCWQSRQAGEG